MEKKDNSPKPKNETEKQTQSPEDRERREDAAERSAEKNLENKETLAEMLKKEEEGRGLTLEEEKEAGKMSAQVKEEPDKQRKTQNIISIAQEKGLFFAWKVVEKLGDYEKDVFHDTFAKDGLYKKFKRRNSRRT